jgi:hypothetical protein
MTRYKFGAAIVLAATLLSMSGTGSAPVRAAEAAAESCTGLTIIALRGSGEGQIAAGDLGDYHLETGGWEGPMLRKVLEAYVKEAKIADTTTTATSVVDIGWNEDTQVGYRALDANHGGSVIDNWQGALWEALTIQGSIYSHSLAGIYLSSKTGVTAGFAALENEMRRTPRGCAQPEFLALGYSQGAMASRMMFAALTDKGPVKNVMSMGDPFQHGEQSINARKAAGLHGDGASGSGVFVLERQAFNSVSDEDEAAMDGTDEFNHTSSDKWSLCHRGDPICDYDWIGGMPFYAPHEDYFEDADEVRQAGRWIVAQSGAVPSRVRAEPDENGWAISDRIAPLWPSREGRLQVDGIPADAALDFELVAARDGLDGDPWDSTLPSSGRVLAVPGKPGITGRDSLVGNAPAHVPKGTHGFIVPSNVPGGIYFLRLTTAQGMYALPIWIDDSITDWYWQDEYPMEGCTPASCNGDE